MQKIKAIEIDLNIYNIILRFTGSKAPLVLHFDTPSRRFYLSVIALIINEMKKQGEPQFIHIPKYKNELQQLDESLSGKHTSKDFNGLLAKIRVAWRNRLPDLETATLFKVLDRDRVPPYERGGKYRYQCSDTECDTWANLFCYDDHNKWRFKFAMDSASLNWDDISLIFDGLRDDSAWNEFMERATCRPNIVVSPQKKVEPNLWKKPGVVLGILLIVVLVSFAIWNFYLCFGPQSTEIPLPNKPSIAVLPFDNMSNNKKEDYFSDGITEDIITTLSKTDQLFVIARNSTFKYKDKPVKIKQVAEELGVRYVLEGSVRKSKSQVRITAQLIDATTGHHLWAEKYDRNLKDIFVLQDEITIKVVNALRIKLTDGEQARMIARGCKTLAYFKVLEALSKIKEGSEEAYIRYGELAQEIVDMDPDCSSGYVHLGWHNYILTRQGKSPRESIAKAFKLAQKALSIDDTNAYSYVLLGNIYLLTGKYEKAIGAGESAVALEPNSAGAHGLFGRILGYADRLDQSIEHLKKALRLDPFPDHLVYTDLCRSYTLKGEYEKALAMITKAIHLAPDSIMANCGQAAIYVLLDRQKEAEEVIKKVLEISPKFSLKLVSKGAFKNKAHLKLISDALRKAGLPD